MNFYQTRKAAHMCIRCGKRTGLFTMPWLAVAAWNDLHYEEQQLTIEEGL